jgi:hypothetical protein
MPQFPPSISTIKKKNNKNFAEEILTLIQFSKHNSYDIEFTLLKYIRKWLHSQGCATKITIIFMITK